MDHIDPVNIKGFQAPFTAEVGSELKKKLKETKTDTYEESLETGDSFEMSENTKGIPDKKKEAFMADAKEEISNLDPNSESFVDDATERLVDSALKREYGEKMANDPGYEQMNQILRKRLLHDPRYRGIIEDFLGKLLESE